MKKLLSHMAGNEVFAYLMFLLILAGGAFAAYTMKREVLPSLAVDIIEVRIPYLGATPEEIEEGICLKIEEAVEGLEGVKKLQTVAQEGMGYAYVEVAEGHEASRVKDELRDRISAITTFPVDAEKPTITEITARSDVLELALWGDFPEKQLKEEAENIKEDLRRLPSLSQVRVSGIRDYEISIEVSEVSLRKYGLTLDQVAKLVHLECQNIPGGSIWTRGEEFKIRTMGRLYRGEEFKDLAVVSRPDGTLITLGQIADIRDAFEEEPVYGRFNGTRAALITVFKTEDEDAIAISNEVRAYVDRKARELPPGLKLTLWSDYSRLIRDRLDLLSRNGMLGLLLVFITLWIFLGSRLSFWVGMGIPVSLSGAMVIMVLCGQSLNMISLFALIMTLGIIVDDAIVVGEAIYVHRAQGKPPFKAALDGVLEVFWPILAAVTTTIVAFLPLFFVTGIMGKFIAVLPVAVVSALGISLFECLFMLPAHLNRLPDMNARDRRKPFLKRTTLTIHNGFQRFKQIWVEKAYDPLIRFALRWRYAALAAALAVLMVVVGVIKGGFVKFVLFPEADTDFLITRVEFPAGTPVEVTQRTLARLEEGLRRVEGRLETESGEPMVLHVYSMVGGYSGYDIQKGSQYAEMRVELIPSERRGLYYKSINSEWQKEVGKVEGALSISYSTFDHGPPGRPIDIWLLGKDYPPLLEAAGEVKTRLRSLKGVFEVEDDHRPGKTELRIKLKPAARTLGLTLSDLGMQMRHGWYGDEPVRIQRGRDDIRIKVRFPMDERSSIADLERIRIRTPAGAEVPFTTVAKVAFDKGLTVIKRNNGRRRIAVTANVNNELANANEIIQDLEKNFLPELAGRYPGVSFSIEGQQRETYHTVRSLMKGFFFAIFAIFLILATVFRSYLQPVIIMITVPLGLIGAVLGHMLFGLDLTIMSLFGLVALTGIVVNDAIVLIECVNTRLAQGLTLFQALIEGGKRRFRAIVLTTFTTCAGVMPLIMERSVQAQYLIPMAVTICTGVLVASVLTLVLVPCLLAITNDLRRVLFWLWYGSLPGREESEPAFKRREFEPSVREACDGTSGPPRPRATARAVSR